MAVNLEPLSTFSGASIHTLTGAIVDVGVVVGVGVGVDGGGGVTGPGQITRTNTTINNIISRIAAMIL